MSQHNLNDRCYDCQTKIKDEHIIDMLEGVYGYLHHGYHQKALEILENIIREVRGKGNK